jgi:hypothetical protein
VNLDGPTYQFNLLQLATFLRNMEAAIDGLTEEEGLTAGSGSAGGDSAAESANTTPQDSSSGPNTGDDTGSGSTSGNQNRDSTSQGGASNDEGEEAGNEGASRYSGQGSSDSPAQNGRSSEQEGSNRTLQPGSRPSQIASGPNIEIDENGDHIAPSQDEDYDDADTSDNDDAHSNPTDSVEGNNATGEPPRYGSDDTNGTPPNYRPSSSLAPDYEDRDDDALLEESPGISSDYDTHNQPADNGPDIWDSRTDPTAQNEYLDSISRSINRYAYMYHEARPGEVEPNTHALNVNLGAIRLRNGGMSAEEVDHLHELSRRALDNIESAQQERWNQNASVRPSLSRRLTD